MNIDDRHAELLKPSTYEIVDHDGFKNKKRLQQKARRYQAKYAKAVKEVGEEKAKFYISDSLQKEIDIRRKL